MQHRLLTTALSCAAIVGLMTAPVGAQAPIEPTVQPSPVFGEAPSPSVSLGFESNNAAPHIYASVDALAWWVSKDRVPTLVTRGNVIDGASAGALGQPNTSVVDPPTNGVQVGIRANLGYWFDADRRWGIEADYFTLFNHSQSFGASSDGSATSTVVVGVPFYNRTTGTEDVYVVAAPGLPGSVLVSTMRRIQGAEANLRGGLWRDRGFSIDGIVGFRFLAIDESIDLSTRNVDAAGLGTATADSFATRNRFYGGQVGLNSNWTWNRIDLNLIGKIALGDMNHQSQISGSTLFTDTVAGTSLTTPGGIFAQNTNIGSRSASSLAYVPEFNARMSYRITDQIRLGAGYSFLWVSSVARPGALIDRSLENVPVLGIPAITNPASAISNKGLWMQGVNLSLEFRF